MPVIKYEPFEAYYVAGILQGVFVGGCVERGDGSSFRRKAHAHPDEKQRNHSHPGWICVRSTKRLYVSGTERPSLLMWHELSHLFVPYEYHGPNFKRMMRRLCGRVDV